MKQSTGQTLWNSRERDGGETVDCITKCNAETVDCVLGKYRPQRRDSATEQGTAGSSASTDISLANPKLGEVNNHPKRLSHPTLNVFSPNFVIFPKLPEKP